MAISDETRKKIVAKIKKCLLKNAPEMVTSKGENPLEFEMIGNKEVPYGHDKKLIPGMFFAGVAQRKDSVAFHFFPCYMNDELKESIPTLYKHLKGKTCFHFKKEEEINEKELHELIQKGANAWKKAGYMN